MRLTVNSPEKTPMLKRGNFDADWRSESITLLLAGNAGRSLAGESVCLSAQYTHQLVKNTAHSRFKFESDQLPGLLPCPKAAEVRACTDVARV
jgi:hypothetical protein